MIRYVKLILLVNYFLVWRYFILQQIMIYNPTPFERLVLPVFMDAKVEVIVKREDLNHPLISGNKWWKLKYNLQKAMNSEITQNMKKLSNINFYFSTI